MKKALLLLVLVLTSLSFAQNLQLHYDFGKDRHYFTTTLEMFKPDEYGSTYLFVDMDYNNKGNKNVSTAYWEIARYVALPVMNNKLSATLQYNDGMTNAFSFDHVWLAGLSYPIDLGFVTLNTDALFRKEHGHDAGFQLTTVWFKPFLDGKVEFSGFIDFWGSQESKDGADMKYVFLTEPQLWYNLNKHLAVGGEVEISNNFIFGENSVQINPTLACKWNF